MKDDKLYLIHILECIERIETYTLEGRDAFVNDPKTQYAVIRNFEVMGEAAKCVSDNIRERSPVIPWRQIAGLRDILVHQYEGVDLDEVWSVVEKELPNLRREVEILLEIGTPSNSE